MQILSRFADGLNVVLGWIAGLFLAISTVAVFMQIAVRFVLPKLGIIVAAPWTEEVSRYLMVWVVFLGVAVLCRSFRLIAVEILVFIVPPKVGTAIKLLAVAICLLFFGIVAQIGFGWTGMSAIEVSPVMRIPMNWVYLAMPIGALVAIFNLLVFAAEVLTGQRSVVDETAEAMD